MSRLQQLHENYNQSPWLDNLRRGWINSGELQRLIDLGVRGLTSNPSIFAKAMTTTDDYDAELAELVSTGTSVNDAYWTLAVGDITEALKLLDPLYQSSNGNDGYVSVEVSPTLAHDTAATVEAARSLHDRVDKQNLYVKVPATVEGTAAIEQLIAEARSINVTLIFGLRRYAEVIEAYLAGLEAADEDDLSCISSVASFFVSRVDVEVDRRLENIGTPEALGLRGKAAIAQSKLAYKMFIEQFSGSRWETLQNKGARYQRLLWASTSTKNREYPDTLYVDSLIGPHTVNTLPESTLFAFDDHGTVARTLDTDVAEAERIVERLAELDIDLEEVANKLEVEGVTAFVEAFDEVLGVLDERARDFR